MMSVANFYKNKVVIITGSSMGIGKELAKQILLWGGKVVINGRNEERLRIVKDEFFEFQNSVIIHTADVTDYESNQELIRKTISCFGKLDILINNAGLSCFGEVSGIKPNVAKQIIDTNIYGSLYPTMSALPELQKTKGSILFISSIAGFYGLPGYSSYSLSKMSLKALAQSIRIELKSKKVFVGISHIGFTENEDEKRTLNAEGQLVNVPKRPKLVTASRKQTALKILRQIKRKKHNQVHSFTGNIAYKINLFFPSLVETIFQINFNRLKKLELER
jgi:short-subunit dehydrogenase